jgi:hypothetical protein
MPKSNVRNDKKLERVDNQMSAVNGEREGGRDRMYVVVCLSMEEYSRLSVMANEGCMTIAALMRFVTAHEAWRERCSYLEASQRVRDLGKDLGR